MSSQQEENFILTWLVGCVLAWVLVGLLLLSGLGSTWIVAGPIVICLWVWFLLWLLKGGAVAKAERRPQYRDAGATVLLMSPAGRFVVLSPEDRMGPYLKAGYRKVKLYTD